MCSGCIAGMHHHRVEGGFGPGGADGTVSGTVNSVDLGGVADFRYLRLAVPFEGQRRDLQVSGDAGVFSLQEVVENRTLRLDVPLFSLKDFSDEPEGLRYPGRMRRRESLELWISGSAGMTPIHPFTATASLVYYRYGMFAVRAYGGASMTPFEGRARSVVDGAEQIGRVQGYGPGLVIGVEVTLAAGEYALELVEFIVDADRSARRATRR